MRFPWFTAFLLYSKYFEYIFNILRLFVQNTLNE